MNVVLVGFGNIGKALYRELMHSRINSNYIVKSSGIYTSPTKLVDSIENYSKYIDGTTVVFISTPSIGKGEISSKYYLEAKEKNAKIVTCEKAFLAYNWNYVRSYLNSTRYSSTVGGNSGIIPEITNFRKEIFEIKAVVNGTLNYVGEKLLDGSSEEEIFTNVIEKGFAEPGSKDFVEVIENELKDVLYKTVILANHSGLYKNIILLEDITVQQYEKNLRCSIELTLEGIKAGFIEENKEWLPQGVNNVLYINGKKITEGPGAGAKATAERMVKDFQELV